MQVVVVMDGSGGRSLTAVCLEEPIRLQQLLWGFSEHNTKLPTRKSISAKKQDSGSQYNVRVFMK